MIYNSFEEKINNLKELYNLKKGILFKLEEDNFKNEKKIKELNDNIFESQKKSILLKKAAEESRENSKKYLEDLVTNALKYVSDEDYRFEIELTESRDRPNAEFYIVTTVNGEESRQKPQDSCGGGFIDIISTALRYAYQELYSDPKINGPIILDEPGKMISENASIKFAEFIKNLSSQFDRQTILVTHNDALQHIANNTNLVHLNNTKSIVTNISKKEV